MLPNIPKFKLSLTPKNLLILKFIIAFAFVALVLQSLFLSYQTQKYISENKILSNKLGQTANKLSNLESQDQVVKNRNLEDEIKNIHDNYKKVIAAYQNILDLKIQTDNTSEIDKLFALSLSYLSDKNYASASSSIGKLNSLIAKQTQIAVQSQGASSPQNVTQSNQAPGSGFSRQAVNTDSGLFSVDIVAADLNSTRVIVDTASDNDCSNDCPVLPLATYVARSGGFAGINGTYFCPASYPSCTGKTNSFDLLVMNKNKHYFNSSNNVYSTNPAVIFSGSSARFVGSAQEWGRDTGVDSVLSNFPLLLSGGNVVGSGGAKGPKGFVGSKGSIAYIGIVKNATFEEAAKVLKALGIENAMNLDEGGSTALWSNGYQDGPGRDIPNAIIFVRK